MSSVNINESILSIDTSHLHCSKLCYCPLFQACTDPKTLKSCRDWLKGSVLGEQLLALTVELCQLGESSPRSASPSSSHSWTLISLVLSQHHNNGKMKLSRLLM